MCRFFKDNFGITQIEMENLFVESWGFDSINETILVCVISKFSLENTREICLWRMSVRNLIENDILEWIAIN